MNILSISMLPLQSNLSQFWKPRSSQNNEVLLFVLAIGILATILIIFNLLKKK